MWVHRSAAGTGYMPLFENMPDMAPLPASVTARGTYRDLDQLPAEAWGKAPLPPQGYNYVHTLSRYGDSSMLESY